jgi:serpin B
LSACSQGKAPEPEPRPGEQPAEARAAGPTSAHPALPTAPVEARGTAREPNSDARGTAREPNSDARGTAREQDEGAPVEAQAAGDDAPTDTLALKHAERPIVAASTLPPHMVSQLNGLALRMLAELEPEHRNLVLAPAAAALAVQLLLPGARGQTALEIQRVFGLKSAQGSLLAKELARVAGAPGPGNTLALLTGLYVDTALGLAPGYERNLRESYHAHVGSLPFAHDAADARAQLERELAAATGGQLDAAASPGAGAAPSSSTRLLVVSALALTATWQTPFDPALTHARPFQRRGQAGVEVPFMERPGEIALGMLGEDTTVIELPFAGGELALDVLAPSSSEGAPKEAFDADTLGRTLERLEPAHVTLRLPRFGLKLPADSLKSWLGALGLAHLFGAEAELHGIASKAGALQVSDLLHAASIELGEHGASAAEPSAHEPQPRGPGASPPVVAVDRPFLFLVRGLKSGLILLAGRFGDPAEH